MPEKFLTFDEVQRRLKIPADELQQLMDGKEINAVVEGGVVKLSERDVLKLARTIKGGAGPKGIEPAFPVTPGTPAQSCPTCFTRPGKKPEDYGFVFLVDEGEEANIEGEAYDGELPTSTVQTPDEDVLKEDFVSPTDLSPEQQEALELFAEMDIERLTEIGRKLSEQSEETPRTFQVPAVSPKAPELPVEPAKEVAAKEPVAPIESELRSPVLEFEQPVVEAVKESEPEPVKEPEAVEEVATPSAALEFVTLEPTGPVETPKPSEMTPETPVEPVSKAEEVEVGEVYELAEAAPEQPVTERAGQATDEELEDVAKPKPEPEVLEALELPKEVAPPVESAWVDFNPDFEKVERAIAEPAASETTKPGFGVGPGAGEAKEAVEGPSERGLKEPEAAKIPAPEAISDLQAREMFDEIEKELEAEGVGGKKTTPVSPAGKPARSGKSEGQGRESAGSKPETKVVSPVETSRPDRGKFKTEEESVVSEDKTKKQEKKPAEDIFEVYDIEEAKTAPKEETKAEPEEEMVELQEASEAANEMETIEQSVDQEMADIFGEGQAAAETEAVEGERTADDFDLSIFKEGGAVTQEAPAMEEVDLSAMTEESPTSGMEGMHTIAGTTSSRIDAITAERGPSTLPVTIAVVLSFLALVFTGMILVALYYSRMPGS